LRQSSKGALRSARRQLLQWVGNGAKWAETLPANTIG
jgi:hypothetical protein